MTRKKKPPKYARLGRSKSFVGLPCQLVNYGGTYLYAPFWMVKHYVEQIKNNREKK